jgi:hypothetical protein
MTLHTELNNVPMLTEISEVLSHLAKAIQRTYGITNSMLDYERDEIQPPREKDEIIATLSKEELETFLTIFAGQRIFRVVVSTLRRNDSERQIKAEQLKSILKGVSDLFWISLRKYQDFTNEPKEKTQGVRMRGDDFVLVHFEEPPNHPFAMFTGQFPPMGTPPVE